MRLHEAAPKLIIQERLGDKVKVSSYWPVPELTRAELALGRLHHALRQNGRPRPWRAPRSWRTRSLLTRVCSVRAPLWPNPRAPTCRPPLYASQPPLLSPLLPPALCTTPSLRSA